MTIAGTIDRQSHGGSVPKKYYCALTRLIYPRPARLRSQNEYGVQDQQPGFAVHGNATVWVDVIATSLAIH